MNKKIKEHFLYFGWLYIIAIIFSIALTMWILPAKTRLKSYEKVGIFLGAKTYDENVLKENILASDDSLLAVDVYAQDPNNFYYVSYLQSAGKQSCDFFILPKSSISDDLVQTLCLFKDEADWKNEFNINTDLIVINNRIYGFILNKDNQILIDAIGFDDENNDEYCLYLNRNSKNLGNFNSINESNHALKAIHTLLGDK